MSWLSHERTSTSGMNQKQLSLDHQLHFKLHQEKSAKPYWNQVYKGGWVGGGEGETCKIRDRRSKPRSVMDSWSCWSLWSPICSCVGPRRSPRRNYLAWWRVVWSAGCSIACRCSAWKSPFYVNKCNFLLSFFLFFSLNSLNLFCNFAIACLGKRIAFSGQERQQYWGIDLKKTTMNMFEFYI